MNCPVCAVALQMTDRQGVEIDYCPKCRGVWLDRGELDKIIERANEAIAQAAAPQPAAQAPPPQPTQYAQPPPPPQGYGGYPPQGAYGHHQDPYYYKKKKKKSFLDELFD